LPRASNSFESTRCSFAFGSTNAGARSPTFKIFSAAAENIKYQPLGAHAGEFGNAIGNALVSIEQGKATPDAAWQKAVADIKNIAG